MSSGFWAATDCPTGGYPRVTARAAPSEVNVFNRRRIRDGKWRVFAAGLAAFAFVFCGSVLSRAAVSAETNSAASADAPRLDTATPDPTPFTGNPEIKTRLDAPGKPTIAGERLHAWLLRPFYNAHGYQTVWDGHPAEAGRLFPVQAEAGEERVPHSSRRSAPPRRADAGSRLGHRQMGRPAAGAPGGTRSSSGRR